MMGRRFLGIQTVISRETRFLRTVWGAILGLMRLNYLSVSVVMISVEYLEIQVNMVGLK